MTVTIRGVTYASTIPGNITLPAGTVAGDILTIVLYHHPDDGYPTPDDLVQYYYDPTLTGDWYWIGGISTVSAGTAVYWRQATSADITAGHISLANASTTAALFTFTGDHLFLLPADWGYAPSTSWSPIANAAADAIGSTAVHTVPITYPGYLTSTAVYVGVLTDIDATASIDRGTSLSDPTSQRTLISYENIDTLDPVTVTLSTAIDYVDDGTSYHSGQLLVFVIREVTDGTGTISDTFATATPVTLAADGDTYVSPVVDNRTYTVETGEAVHRYDYGDGTYDDVGLRSAWWAYTPATAGTLSIDTELNPGYAYSTLFLCAGSSVDALTVLDYNDNAGPHNTAKIVADVEAGTTYYIKVGSYTATANDDTYYCLRLTGPASGAPASNITVSCPLIDTTATVYTYDPLAAPDNFANAYPVIIAVAGNTWTSHTYDNTEFTRETGEPADGFRSAWWKYEPKHSGMATFTTSGSSSHDSGTLLSIRLDLYDGDTLSTLTRQASATSYDTSDYLCTITRQIYAGHTYYVRVANMFDGAGMTIALNVTGPETVGVLPLVVDLPPVQNTVNAVLVEPVRIGVGTRSPAAGTVVPTSQPVFTVPVSRAEPGDATVDVTIIVQQIEDNGVTSGTWTTQVSALLAYTHNTVNVIQSTALPDGTYYWTAVVSFTDHLPGGVTVTHEVARTLNQAIVIATAQSAGTVPVSWEVAAGSAATHLWFVHPAAGKPGDTVTAVGHGTTVSAVTVNGTPATLGAVTQVPATSATTGRRINPYTGATDAEHFTAVFTVPDIGAPGGPVVLSS